MRKIAIIAILTLTALLIFSCGGNTEAADAAAETEVAAGDGIYVENAFYFTHVNGHREETEMPAFVLFEYEQLETVKYQVAYIACTCRAPQVNYWSVMYVDLNKSDGSVAYISWDMDSTDHYTAGMYGDSVETWEGVPAWELLLTYTDDNILGASQDSINAIEPMHGEADAYTGATVTPNNVVRVLQGLFEYHNTRYM
jgi:hypothetical protein